MEKNKITHERHQPQQKYPVFGARHRVVMASWQGGGDTLAFAAPGYVFPVPPLPTAEAHTYTFIRSLESSGHRVTDRLIQENHACQALGKAGISEGTRLKGLLGVSSRKTS